MSFQLVYSYLKNDKKNSYNDKSKLELISSLSSLNHPPYYEMGGKYYQITLVMEPNYQLIEAFYNTKFLILYLTIKIMKLLLVPVILIIY